MRCFWDGRQQAHAPAIEFFNGALHSAAETPARAEAVLAAIGRTEAPLDHGREPILRAHDPDYVVVLETAHEQWRAADREGDALPYCFAPGVRGMDVDRIDAKLGLYAYDTCAPITGGTWEAAYWAVQCALSALDVTLGGEHAFALTRPPGHHAGRATMGGYSYLNHGAVAALAAADAGRDVAILDLDYHHGNGTEGIVEGEKRISFASLHADPATDYPFFWGRESHDNILNRPLPRGTAFDCYDAALAEALDWIGERGAELLVISFGADTFINDPISHFRLRTEDYAALSRRIAATGLPTLTVLEGGYAIDALGANVAAFLSGF